MWMTYVIANYLFVAGLGYMQYHSENRRIILTKLKIFFADPGNTYENPGYCG